MQKMYSLFRVFQNLKFSCQENLNSHIILVRCYDFMNKYTYHSLNLSQLCKKLKLSNNNCKGNQGSYQ